MQLTLDHIFPRKSQVVSAPARSVSHDRAHAPSRPMPLLIDMWRETVEILSRQAAPLLLVGLIGFAVAPLIGPVLAMIGMPLARIAIMQMVVYGRLNTPSLRQWAALLIVGWVYALALIVGQIGIGVPLRKWGINLNFAEQKSTSWEAAAQTVSLRSVDALSLTSNSPFKRWLPGWRNWVFDELVQKPSDNYEQELIASYWRNDLDVLAGSISSIEAQAIEHRENRPELRWMFDSGVITLILAETLFVFRSLPGIKTTQIFWLSLKHFGAVAGHLWFLRLVLVSLNVAFVFAPNVIVDRYTYLAHDWGWFGSPLQVWSLSVCRAAINAVCMTFEAVYAARLFVALSPSKVLQP